MFTTTHGIDTTSPIQEARDYLAHDGGDPAARVIIQNLLNYISGIPSVRRLEYRFKMQQIDAMIDSLKRGELREEYP